MDSILALVGPGTRTGPGPSFLVAEIKVSLARFEPFEEGEKRREGKRKGRGLEGGRGRG